MPWSASSTGVSMTRKSASWARRSASSSGTSAGDCSAPGARESLVWVPWLERARARRKIGAISIGWVLPATFHTICEESCQWRGNVRTAELAAVSSAARYSCRTRRRPCNRSGPIGKAQFAAAPAERGPASRRRASHQEFLQLSSLPPRSDAEMPVLQPGSPGATAASRTHLVVIPSYNTGRKVYETVRDARAHWAPVWVVVDGSTDGTAEGLRADGASRPAAEGHGPAAEPGQGQRAPGRARSGAARRLHACAGDGLGWPAPAGPHRRLHAPVGRQARRDGARAAGLRCLGPVRAGAGPAALEPVHGPGDPGRRHRRLPVRLPRLPDRRRWST